MADVPRHRVSLNGTWRIRPGDADPPTGGWERSVPVPGLVDLAVPAYRWQESPYHWYRTEFAVPAGAPNGPAFLTIEQAMFGTEVWVNGRRLGGDIGCYTSQEYDLGPVLRRGASNELVVRVGDRSTLPPESAVGKDQERAEFIPGIWGDVHLDVSGSPRVRLVQVIPHVAARAAEVRAWIENSSAVPVEAEVRVEIRELLYGRTVAATAPATVHCAPLSEARAVFHATVDPLRLWGPAQPFLYEAVVVAGSAGVPTDRRTARFGMRAFRIEGGDFLLNGKKVLLRGGNIAFHRFLSDRNRGSLPWDEAWVRRLLVDIPRAHNFNFFRFHIGQAYNRWYDIADEGGMLLQNEWQFWTTTGTGEQITREFTRWLQDNWNHPSIVVWDPLNESSDPVVQREIVPRMKELDPTRPWESVDFTEEHPYIYSLGPVLNDRTFGFTRAMAEIERSPLPTMLNEFLWWWMDDRNRPTALMEGVVERWLGPGWTESAFVERQSVLARELVELFRRMQVDAIQPFVYLSNSAGPTGNWFAGPIADLTPKPVLAALRNAFAPFGVSIELWDRHFSPGEEREVRVFVFNDTGDERRGSLRFGVVDAGGAWVVSEERGVAVAPASTALVPLPLRLPARPGSYLVRAELHGETGPAWSEKPAHVVAGPPSGSAVAPVAVAEGDGELSAFLSGQGVQVRPAAGTIPRGTRTVVLSWGTAGGAVHEGLRAELTLMVRAGGTLVVIEPELGAEESRAVPLLEGLEITVGRRADVDKGGYDSYVFAEDHTHPLWGGIQPEHLVMFNGALGGEVVSQHDVATGAPHAVLARCGLKLGVAAVLEIPFGGGLVIVSRLQARGRLVARPGSDDLFARRSDPVMHTYMLNLLSYASAAAQP